MKQFIFLILLSCRLIFCSQTKGKPDIIGGWCLVETKTLNEINYESIFFDKDGGMTLSTRADTIYFFSYSVNNSTLVINREDRSVSLCGIEKMTADSLILSSLLEKKAVQKYYRCAH